jgi:hypothetical protein
MYGNGKYSFDHSSSPSFPVLSDEEDEYGTDDEDHLSFLSCDSFDSNANEERYHSESEELQASQTPERRSSPRHKICQSDWQIEEDFESLQTVHQAYLQHQFNAEDNPNTNGELMCHF